MLVGICMAECLFFVFFGGFFCPDRSVLIVPLDQALSLLEEILQEILSPVW